MKNTKIWGRIGIVVVTAMMIIISLFALTACNDKLDVETLSVVEDSIPGVAVVDKFDITQINLSVVLADGSVQTIAAERSMLTAEAREALKTPGQKNITLYYAKKTVVVSILLVDSDTETVSVVFLSSDGKKIAEKHAVKGGSITAPTPPTSQDGKVFAGWVNNKDGSTINLDKVDASATVSATYSENLTSHTVTFIDYKNNVVSTSTVRHGDRITPPSYSKPAEIASFSWGDIDFNTYTVTNSVTFRMSYQYVTKTVRYYYAYENMPEQNFELVDGSKKLYYESVVINKAMAGKEQAKSYLSNQNGASLTFIRWKEEPTSVVTDIIMVAIVEPRTYTISYVNNDFAQETINVGMPYQIKSDANAKEGHTFNGKWRDLVSGKELSGGTTVTVTADMRLEAIYNKKSVAVQLNISFEQGNDDPIVAEILLDYTEYGDIINLDFVADILANYIQDKTNLANYKVDKIEYNEEDTTAENIALTVLAGDAAHQFAITAVDSSLPTKGLVFTLVGESYTVSGFSGDAINIFIPQYYQEVAVTAIGNNVFSGKTINIDIPSTVTTIGSGAFEGATLLSDINLPALTFMGEGVFQNATTKDNKKITVSFDSNSTIDALPSNTFYGSSNIITVVLSDSIKTIGESAFEDSQIVTVDLSNIESLAEKAFYNANKFANITNLNNLQDIGAYALANTAIATLNLPKVESVAEFALADMTKLTSLSIGTDTDLASENKIAFDLAFIMGSVNIVSLTIGDTFKKLTVDLTTFDTNAAFVTQQIYLPQSLLEVEVNFVDGSNNPSPEMAILGRIFSSLVAINVDSANTVYQSIDGVLFGLHEDSINLMVYPTLKKGDYTVPTVQDMDVVVDKYALELATIANFTIKDTDVLALADYLAGQKLVLGNILSIIVLVQDGTSLTLQQIVDSFKLSLEAGTNIYLSGDIDAEEFADLTTDNAWNDVFLLDGSGTQIIYNSEYDLIYSVNSNKATILYGNKGAKVITIPQQIDGIVVNEIRDGAFSNYQYLESLIINATLKAFYNDTISGCANLSEIFIASWENNALVSMEAFEGTLYFDRHNVILLGGRLIGYNNNAKVLNDEEVLVPLTVVTEQDLLGVVAIPNSFFKGSNITAITLPSSVKTIGENAFENCASLHSINLNSVTDLQSFAFANSGLTNIDLAQVSKLGESVFINCAGLVSVSIPKAVNNGVLPFATFESCTALTTVDMPYITRFAEKNNKSRAFYGCSSLKNIGFISQLASVPAETFMLCTAIESIDFTATPITSIKSNAFRYCASLTHIVIGATITEIGTNAFANGNLKSVKIVGTSGILSSNNQVLNATVFPAEVKIYIQNNASEANLINYINIVKTLPTLSFAMMENFSANVPLNKDSLTEINYITSAPSEVVISGYIFDGWYTKDSYENYHKAEFPMNILANTTLYAKYYSLVKGSLVDSDLEYDENLKGWALVKFANYAAEEIFIPSTYTKKIDGVDKNYPIVAIYAGAFSACSNLTEIIIPEGVKYLSDGGYFEDGSENANGVFNQNLNYIYLPASLEQIKGDLFTGNANLDIEFAPNSKLYLADTSAFEGTKWYLEEVDKAEDGMNNGFVLAGRLAISYHLPSTKIVSVPSNTIKLNDALFASNIVIEEIKLNDELLYIGTNCFVSATNLRYVSYVTSAANSKLKELDLSAFVGTKWLANQNMVIVGTILSKYNDYDGETTVVIPDYITEISAEAFKDSTLRYLQFGANSQLKIIADRAFASSSLVSVTLPASVQYLGESVFESCQNLVSADLSNINIDKLPSGTFDGCAKLETLTLATAITALGSLSLQGCSKLSTIVANGIVDTNKLGAPNGEGGSGLVDTAWYNKVATEQAQYLVLGKVLVKYIAGSVVNESGTVVVATIPSGVKVILERAFENSAIHKAVISSSVEKIEANAFAFCAVLNTVEFDSGSNLKVIGEAAFRDCDKLKTISLPNGLEIIEDYAFTFTAIEELIIPDSVIRLGLQSFANISALTYIRLGSGVVELDEQVFYNNDNLYKIDWAVSDNQLKAIAAYIESNIDNYDTTKYRNYVNALFGADSTTRGRRIYVESATYNFIHNSGTETELAKQITAWSDRTTFGIFISGDYPEITFENDQGYVMDSFKTETITTIGVPAKTGHTFVGWYLDALHTQPLVLPYAVYESVQLYAKWYKNDIEDALSDTNLAFVYSASNQTYTVSGVQTAVTDLYIPATVNGAKVKSINLTVDAPMVKTLYLTDASNFNDMTSNIFRFFPNLEKVVLYNSGTVSLSYKIEDGVVYSIDGTKILAYIARFASNGTQQGQKLTSFAVPLAVTEIYNYAFANSGLVDITLNRNVAKIGYHAFNDSLTTINFAVSINITDADSQSFENTAWYQSSAVSTENTAQSAIVGYFYSAGNMLLEYREIAKINKLVIPNSLKSINITTIASYIHTESRNQNNTVKLEYTDLELPDALLKINEFAFKDINITNNITTGTLLSDIADNVFSDTDFYINNNSTMLRLGKVLVKWVSTDSHIVVPEGIVSISKNAFNNSQVVSVVLPQSLVYIGDYAFYSCGKLLTVSIPNNVVYIGEKAFANNSLLAEVTFDTNLSKLKTIGDSAFNNCKKLTAIAIPYGVESIGKEAFLNCELLKTVTFDYIKVSTESGEVTTTIEALSKLTKLGASAFENCKALEEIKIPNGITVIEEETFYNCQALLNVKFDIGKSELRIIEARAFSNCIKLGSKIDIDNPKLVTVELPTKLHTIKEYAFEKCRGMYGIQLNYNVKNIGSFAFLDCVSLAKIDIYSGTPAILAEDALTREISSSSIKPYYKLRIYVNVDPENNYKIAYQNSSSWSRYASMIYQRDELPKLVYTRITTGAGGTQTQTYSTEIFADVLVNPKYQWGTTEYTSWDYNKFYSIILGEDYMPILSNGSVQYEEINDDIRIDREFGVDSYQKFEQDSVTYKLLVIDYDYIVLKARN